MRFFSTLTNDIRYQAKYGFYFLYVFFSGVYIGILLLVPPEHKQTAASIIILSDPAMLGCFFIGGIWLLEKSEGLHQYWEISPLRPMEYILSKALSLALVSTAAAILIAMIGLREGVNYFALSLSVLLGSMVFTLLGLVIATYARSVNQYMIRVSPLLILAITPPILTAVGIPHPAFEISPGTALWRFIIYAMDGATTVGIWPYCILLSWLCITLVLACRRIPSCALYLEGGDKL